MKMKLFEPESHERRHDKSPSALDICFRNGLQASIANPDTKEKHLELDPTDVTDARPGAQIFAALSRSATHQQHYDLQNLQQRQDAGRKPIGSFLTFATVAHRDAYELHEFVQRKLAHLANKYNKGMELVVLPMSDNAFSCLKDLSVSNSIHIPFAVILHIEREEKVKLSQTIFCFWYFRNLVDGTTNL